jgi:hypothetical protein
LPSTYQQAILRLLLDEEARRSPPPSSDEGGLGALYRREGWAGLLSEPQRLRVFCPERFQAWPAGRQSGKTDGAEKLLLMEASDPARRGQQVLYVSTSIKRAIATIWDELVLLNQDLGLGGRVNASRHEISFPGAGKLVVTGCESRAMANDIRGRKKVALYVIDESQDWDEDLLRYFYEVVVYPSLVAVRGRVIFCGTGCAPRGFWWEVATGANPERARPEFTRFPRWTPYDNPYLPEGEARELVAKACRDRGCDDNDPSIQTEFFCAFVADLARQIFPVIADNLFDRGTWDPGIGWWTGGDLPGGEWSIVLGNDFGTVDAAAWVAIGWTTASPHLWILETDKQEALGSGAQVAQVLTVAERYSRLRLKGRVYVVGDPGGGGKSHIVTLRQEHWLPIEAAEKADKAAACLALRGGLRSLKVKVAREEQEFVRELQAPEWDPNAVGKVIKGHMPDRVDGALYGYRKAVVLHHYKAPPPPKTSEQRELERQLAAQAQEERLMRDLGLA